MDDVPYASVTCGAIHGQPGFAVSMKRIICVQETGVAAK